MSTYGAGVNVYMQGDSADAFYVLLDGEIELVKRMDGTDVVLSTTSQPGSYAGVMRAFISASGAQSWASSLRTVQASRLFKLSADDFAYLLQTWFPMAVHLLDGMFLGLTNADALIGQREKLIALGALSAGLAHELNNPAAAEVRAAEALNARILDARSAMVKLAPEAEQRRTPRPARAPQRSPRAGSGCARASPPWRRATSKTPWPTACRRPGWTTPGSWRPSLPRPGSMRRGWIGWWPPPVRTRPTPSAGWRPASTWRAWSARSATPPDGSQNWWRP